MSRRERRAVAGGALPEVATPVVTSAGGEEVEGGGGGEGASEGEGLP